MTGSATRSKIIIERWPRLADQRDPRVQIKLLASVVCTRLSEEIVGGAERDFYTFYLFFYEVQNFGVEIICLLVS